MRKAHRAGEPREWDRAREELAALLAQHWEATRRKHVLRKIGKYFGQDKSLRILDFGCGAGQTVLYLRLLGYVHTYGIGPGPQEENNRFLRSLEMKESIFFQYDKQNLPFRNASFDLVISEQVLEHVFDLESYYREAARVLRAGGMAYFNFPHRFVPFDSHSRTWLIHFLPSSVRAPFYRLAGKDPNYYGSYLNYRSIGHHRKIAARYFSCVENETGERLLAFEEEDLMRYEGNRRVRSALDRLMKARLAGPLVLPVVSRLSNVDLCLFRSRGDRFQIKTMHGKIWC